MRHSARVIHRQRRINCPDTDDTKPPCHDIDAIPTVPSVPPSRSGPAMTKTISIYAAQVLLGAIAIAIG